MENPDFKGLYFITDSKLTKKDIFSDVKAALKAGVKVIQYREKEKNSREKYIEALMLKKIIKNKALLIINNDIDVVLYTNADGIHIGQKDIPYYVARNMLGNKIIGVTVHNIEQAKNAEKLGAAYIAVSPIFSTNTKKDAGKPVGTELIKKLKKEIKIPIVAIGGITQKNVDSTIEAGAEMVCMISAIVAKDNVEKECRNIMKKFR